MKMGKDTYNCEDVTAMRGLALLLKAEAGIR